MTYYTAHSTEDVHLIPSWEEGHEEARDCGCQPVLKNADELAQGVHVEAIFMHRTRSECLQ